MGKRITEGRKVEKKTINWGGEGLLIIVTHSITSRLFPHCIVDGYTSVPPSTVTYIDYVAF